MDVPLSWMDASLSKLPWACLRVHLQNNPSVVELQVRRGTPSLSPSQNYWPHILGNASVKMLNKWSVDKQKKWNRTCRLPGQERRETGQQAEGLNEKVPPQVQRTQVIRGPRNEQSLCTELQEREGFKMTHGSWSKVLKEEHLRQRKQQVQSSWGRTSPGPRDSCGWETVNKWDGGGQQELDFIEVEDFLKLFLFKIPHINDTMQYLSFPVQLISLIIRFSSYIYVIANGRIPFFLTVE